MKSCPRPMLWTCGLILLTLCNVACQSSSRATTAAAGPPHPPVSVIEVKAQDVPVYGEYTAQTYARDLVEVRARVNGYVEKRTFQIGSDVQAGQVLYVLDLRPYQAEVDRAKGLVAESDASVEYARRQVALAQAQADLAQAEANQLKAQQDVTRLQPLVKQDAAAQQDLDNAEAALKANQANVNARKAAVEQARLSTRAQVDTTRAQLDTSKATLKTAELNLEYATIRAPIAGRIGDSLVQPGGLVTPASPPLTTIVPLDPMWVRFKVSETEYLNLKRPDNRTLRSPLDLILADGSLYPHKGKIQNTVNQVDQRTGTLELQASFPNPEHTLLPGQFGRIKVTSSETLNAILIPQRAVQELQGTQTVLTVGPDNKVLSHAIVTSGRLDDQYIVQQGLQPGDHVIVEGIQKARPGAVVNPQPWQPPQPRK